MSNVQITKRRGNVTTGNPLLICEEVTWFSDGSKSSAHSLPWMTSSRLKTRLQRSESECLPHPPGKHKLENMRWLSPLSPGHAQGGWVGFKWLVHNSVKQSQNFSPKTASWGCAFFSCPSTGHSIPSVNLFDAVKSNQGPSDFCCSGETESTWPDHWKHLKNFKY